VSTSGSQTGEPFLFFLIHEVTKVLMKISVFGGTKPKEGSTAYAEAQELGRLLAEGGHVVSFDRRLYGHDGKPSHAARRRPAGM